MPGDYLFPKRKFKSGEPLETVELNDALQTSVERLNGHLNPHNIRAPIDANLSSAVGTFFDTKVAVVDVESGMSHAAASAGSSPKPGVGDAFLLEQETGWVPITGSEDMAVEMTTGSSSLSITAHASHCFAGQYDGSNAVYETTVPKFNGSRSNEVRNGALNKNDGRALVRVTVVLGSFSTVFTIRVPDARTYDSLIDQSKDIAEEIVRSRSSFRPDYIVSRTGRTLRFKSTTAGATVATRSISYETRTGPSFTRTEDIDVVANGSAPTAGGSNALSDLDSCDPANNPTVLLYYPAQIQYALRVDGVVLTETITGRFDNEQAPLTPSRISNPRDINEPVATNSKITGPSQGPFRERPDAINIPMFSVRLTASLDVAPGDHLVELVVRRVPTGRKRSFVPPPPSVGDVTLATTYLPVENRVYIYSRQLAVTDIPKEPVESAPFETASVVKSYKDEDVVSKKTLVDQRLQSVASDLNEVKSYQLARGSINGDHLEKFSSVIATASGFSITDTQVTSATNYYVYPTVASAFSATLNLYEAPPSWQQLLVRNLNGSLVDGRTTPLECVITVEANVFLRRLVHQGLKQSEMHLAAATFIIGLYDPDAAKYYLYRPSLSWVNSNNYFAHQVSKGGTDLHDSGSVSATVGLNYLSRYGPHGANKITENDVPGDFVDVPVTAYIDFSGTDSAGNSRALTRRISQVALFTSAAWMGSAYTDGPTRFRTSRFSLNAVVMKS